MKTKTNELIGEALDYAVAKCEGVNGKSFFLYYDHTETDDYDEHGFPEFHYSTVWSQAGKIIERECIAISCIHTTGYTPDTWTAHHPQRVWARGSTPLIAAMRCYVASKLGDEVEIPEEVTNEHR